MTRFVAALSLAALGCGAGPKAPADTGSTQAGAPATDGSSTEGSADPNFYVFLLIGQSNMEGVPKPEAPDRELSQQVKMLSYDDCSNLARKHDQWYTAAPPLHGCFAGVGPGDSFGKAMAAAFPEATIGLVPCAISGVDIDFFRKGVTSARREEFRIPPDDHWSGAYDWVLERARLAQRSGVIRGIIFHQGESDTGSASWLDGVSEMVRDLRADLGLGEVPFIAGELLYGGCCESHNPIVNQLPERIPNSFVVSAAGLGAMDEAHFDLAGQRELGARYAAQMLEALR